MSRVLLLAGVALLSATTVAGAQVSSATPVVPGPAAPVTSASSAQVPWPEGVPANAPVPVPGPSTPIPLPPVAPATVPTSPAPRVFASEAGMVVNPIKPAQTATFEAIVKRVKDALATSDDPVRRQQAIGWKVYKAGETGVDGAVYYLFVIDPVVKGADYTIAKVLYEAYPAEINTLLKQFLGSYAGGQTLLNLTLVSNLRLGAK